MVLYILCFALCTFYHSSDLDFVFQAANLRGMVKVMMSEVV